MTEEVKAEVEKLLRAGERRRAIEHLENTFQISPQDATILVEALEREIGVLQPDVEGESTVQGSTRLDRRLRAEVEQLLHAGRKMEAVNYVRQNVRVGLREALVMVEEVAREVNPNYTSFNLTGCLQFIARGVGIFLMIVSIVFLVAAAVIYFLQSLSIRNSDRVAGRVTEMKSNGTGATAPVVAYEWRGKKRSYESTYYSSPPDYYVGEGVFLFVNRDDPDDITIDTFVDRWALIVGLSVPGVVVLVISIVFLNFSKRKF